MSSKLPKVGCTPRAEGCALTLELREAMKAHKPQLLNVLRAAPDWNAVPDEPPTEPIDVNPLLTEGGEVLLIGKGAAREIDRRVRSASSFTR